MSQAGNSNLTRIYIVIAFLAVGSLLFYAYRTMQSNVESLVRTVRESADPDINLIQLKEIWSGVQRAENDVRSYTVTGDQTYLIKFIGSKDSLRHEMDSLRATVWPAGNDTVLLKQLDSLVDLKIAIYDSLLDLSYSRILSGALTGLGNTVMVPDSFATVTDEGTVLQRLFSTRYSRKAIKAKTDSLIIERNNLVREYNRNLKKIQQEEEEQLRLLKQRELALLRSDKLVTAQIERKIRALEERELFRIREKAAASEALTTEAASRIRYMVLAGLIVVLLLFILVLLDIEASNKRRLALVEARNRAEKLAKAKEEFMSTMSHEIRTPLTSIIGFAGKLKHTTLDPTQQRYSKAITGSSEHLLAIVNDVLDFTRVDAGKLNFDRTPFRPADIFREVTEALSWKADEKNILLKLDNQLPAGLVLAGDPVRLRQVLFNIAGNAVKFTDQGSVVIQTSYTGEKGVNNLFIRITDTGIGIPADKQQVIFDEFVQADSTTEGKYGGTGLGLAITKRIVEQQGGNITVSSDPGKGAVFTINIPYEQIDTVQEAPETAPPETGTPLKGLTIILAEDDEMIRELQLHTLQRLGASVIVAEDGKAAIRALEQQPADLILMDVRMPGMGGPEAVRVIRTGFAPPLRDIPVIAMSANVIHPDERNEWLREGMNDFISKPFREEELLERIQQLLKHSRQHPAAVAEVRVQQAAKGGTGQPLFDLSELVTASNGNPEFVKKMTGLFMTTAYASLNNLKFYHKQQNWEQLERTAHRMIGSYKQMGITEAASMLKQLEKIASSTRNTAEASGLVTGVERISLEVFDALKKSSI